jgi:hypothetical protein
MLPNGGGDGSAFSCLTPAAMREFNEQTPDVPEIKYFSWGAVYSPGLIDTWKCVFSIHLPPFIQVLIPCALQMATLYHSREGGSK